VTNTPRNCTFAHHASSRNFFVADAYWTDAMRYRERAPPPILVAQRPAASQRATPICAARRSAWASRSRLMSAAHDFDGEHLIAA